MATKLLANTLTVSEMAKRRGADGNVATIAEVLEELNEVLVDAPAKEANNIFAHMVNKRDRLPRPSTRMINKGAIKTASSVRQEEEYLCLLEDWIEIDEELIDHESDPKQARVNEISAHLEGAMQELSRLMFYGNRASDPSEINGFNLRYNSLALPNVWNAGGSGSDTASIMMAEWDLVKGAYLIYPRGDKNIGIHEDDKGKIPTRDSLGNPFDAYTNKVKFHFGITVVDDKCIQRMVNIESLGVTNNLIDSMETIVDMKNRLPKRGKNAVCYVPRDLHSQFEKWALNKSNLMLTMEQLKDGTPLVKVLGVPLRTVDELLTTEAALV